MLQKKKFQQFFFQACKTIVCKILQNDSLNTKTKTKRKVQNATFSKTNLNIIMLRSVYLYIEIPWQ